MFLERTIYGNEVLLAEQNICLQISVFQYFDDYWRRIYNRTQILLRTGNRIIETAKTTAFIFSVFMGK